MSLTAGTLIGPYEIVALVGAGGMGEVYKARDTRLDRAVAVKILPASLAADPDRRERFEREARAASSLNHPHICALYDIGHQQGIDYLVMELLDGESLADRLAKGPLPLDQALRLGIDIADALSKAHRQGIVHRDLKPANVMLTKQGAKLLDFGLARVDVPPAGGPQGSFLPTQQKSLTQAGTVLGTFQYMAPEQLEGGDADARTDIFAFGALLYEALTGRRAFEAKSQASLISAIMAGTPPPISTRQPMAPPALERVIRTCLAKDPDERWQTAQDLGAELKWIAEGGSQIGAPAPVVARRKSKERWAWIAAAVLALVSAVSIGRLLTMREAPREPTRFIIAPPKGVTLSWPRISPDGRTVAFLGVDQQNRRSIWVRPMGSFDAIHLDGTDGVQRPFWSPDSRYLGFFAGGQLKKVSASGGPPQLLCEAPGGADGSWSSKGVILFDGRVNDPIRRVPDSGGVPVVVAKPDATRKEGGTAWPFFLPDGRHFLFLANDANGPVTMKVGSLDSADVTVLGESESRVEYSSGHLFYVSRKTLMARPFSPDTLSFVGDPFPVTDRIEVGNLGLVDFSTSHTGDLAYSSAAQEPRSRLAWIDRNGKEVGIAGEPGLYRDMAISPDETRVAASMGTFGGRSSDDSHIWVVDLKRGVSSRLTFGTALYIFPIWSADNMHIAYATPTKEGQRLQIVKKLASGAGDEQPIGDDKDGIIFPTDWSSDGQQLLVQWLNQGSDNFDILTLTADGHGSPAPFLRAPKPIFEQNGRFSPDRRWIAYQSNESGRLEVYVQAFPRSGGKWQISTAGGSVPMWRGDGREIFYQAAGDTFYAVPVRVAGDGLDIGLPEKLFQRRVAHDARERNRWVVTRDGQRFLLNTPMDDGGTRSIQVVLSWAASLKKP